MNEMRLLKWNNGTLERTLERLAQIEDFKSLIQDASVAGLTTEAYRRIYLENQPSPSPLSDEYHTQAYRRTYLENEPSPSPRSFSDEFFTEEEDSNDEASSAPEVLAWTKSDEEASDAYVHVARSGTTPYTRPTQEQVDDILNKYVPRVPQGMPHPRFSSEEAVQADEYYTDAHDDNNVRL